LFASRFYSSTNKQIGSFAQSQQTVQQLHLLKPRTLDTALVSPQFASNFGLSRQISFGTGPTNLCLSILKRTVSRALLLAFSMMVEQESSKKHNMVNDKQANTKKKLKPLFLVWWGLFLSYSCCQGVEDIVLTTGLLPLGLFLSYSCCQGVDIAF
jgi:hypothetical protein